MEQGGAGQRHPFEGLSEFTQSRGLRQEVVALQGYPATPVLVARSPKPLVLPAPVSIALVHGPNDGWSEDGPELHDEWVPQDVGGGSVEHLSRRGQLLALDESSDRHYERLNVRFPPWRLASGADDDRPPRERRRGLSKFPSHQLDGWLVKDLQFLSDVDQKGLDGDRRTSWRKDRRDLTLTKGQ